MAYLLVVDDYPESSRIISELLLRRGHMSDFYTDYTEALDSLRQQDFDGVIAGANSNNAFKTKVCCPGYDSWAAVIQFLQVVADEKPDLPVMVLTAEDLDLAEMELRAKLFVSKYQGEGFRDRFYAAIDELVKNKN